MTGKPKHPAWLFPKRLGSLMVIVAVSALAFQMVRGVTPQPATIVTRTSQAARARVRLNSLFSRQSVRPTTANPRAERPFFVVDTLQDGPMLKDAPEGIDDAMILNPQTLPKR